MPMHEAGVHGFALERVRDVAPSLDETAVHLWWLPHQRADRRAPLNALLAEYLGVDAQAVVLVDDAHGRPHLAASHALDFNWSHSGDHALVAMARNLPALGVDIEWRRSRPRALALAKRFFAHDEYTLLQSLPPAQREEAFIRLWTAKEAVLKAHGRGIAYGLDRVAFTLEKRGQVHFSPSISEPDPVFECVRAVEFRGEIGAVRQWQFHDLCLAPEFAGAVAWRGTPRQLRRFRAL